MQLQQVYEVLREIKDEAKMQSVLRDRYEA